MNSVAVSPNPLGDVAVTADDPAKVASPATITGRAPRRSTSQPDTGASANIPRVCAESIVPISSRCAPCMCIDSGAAVMTATITTWATTMVAAADRTALLRNTLGRPAAAVRTGRIRGAPIAATRAPSTAMAASRNGPVMGENPAVVAASWAGIISNGPLTAPTVPAQITEPIATPRRSGG